VIFKKYILHSYIRSPLKQPGTIEPQSPQYMSDVQMESDNTPTLILHIILHNFSVAFCLQTTGRQYVHRLTACWRALPLADKFGICYLI